MPHDAMLGAPRDESAPAGSASGYFHGTAFTYRKTFGLSAEQLRGTMILEFGCVYRDARITVNGESFDVPPYGFVPFFLDISDAAVEGDNVIEVAGSNADQPDCRWYSGAGLLRPVWLWEGPRCCIAPEAIRVTTTSVDPAHVRVEIDCEKTPEVRILCPEGLEVARGSGRVCEFEIADALPWSAEHPWLYRLEAWLEDERGIVDAASLSFGIRMLTWSPSGLFVNGEPTLLRGGCIHCDNGIAGGVSFSSFEKRRIRLLKQAGFNAVRIAHNPAPESLLDACDEIGMYVMDEAWDVWYTPKSRHDYSRHFLDWCDHDLARLAARDYNHPSVIMYSIGNEVADPLNAAGVALEKSMVELLHSLDPTRPVTCGLNLTMMVMERMGQGWYDDADGVAEQAAGGDAPHASMLFNLSAQIAGTGMTMLSRAPGADKLVSPALDALDIAGYNYASARYPVDARKHPGRIIVGSETFPHELHRNWKLVKSIPQVIGDFMWAAWDYLGEAGAGAWAYTAEEAGFSKPWPWLVAGSGALDLMGQPGAPAALAGAVWNTNSAPSIQVRPVNLFGKRTYKATWRGSDAIPSWSWSGCEAQPARIEVYDGAGRFIRLLVNGREIETRRLENCVARFACPYEPGSLTAMSLDEDGRELSRSTLLSASAPFHLEVKLAAKPTCAGDLALVDVAIVGSNGAVESNADAELSCTVENGVLLGFGSAQPAPLHRFGEGRYPTYRGRAQAAICRDVAGCAMLTVSGGGFSAQSLQVEFE